LASRHFRNQSTGLMMVSEPPEAEE
jgi:hypothetical protein